MTDGKRVLDGKRVKARRKALGLSQAALAIAAKLSQPSISKIENGDIEGQVAETQEALAAALQTSVAYLRGETDDALGGARTPTVERDAAHEPDDDETPLESALFEAMAPDPRAFTSKDFDLARRVIRETHRYAKESYDMVAIATDLLQAAKAVRLSGEQPTVVSVLSRWAYGKQDAAQRARAEERSSDATAAAANHARDIGYGEAADFPPLKLPKK